IIDGPPEFSSSTSAGIRTRSNDDGLIKTFEWRLHGSEGQKVDNSDAIIDVVLNGLSDGLQAFEVRVTDEAGNTATATRKWTIDLLPPDTEILAGPCQRPVAPNARLL